jgi:hypothetical protein
MKQILILIYSVIISALFLAWISVPCTIRIFNLVKQDTISKQENRMLAKKPEFNIDLLDPYPVTYEKFYNDHFPFRKLLANFQTREIRLKLLNRPPDLEGLYVGKDGWLFTLYERQYWQGTNKYTRDDVKTIAGILHKRALEYRARGIKFYIISPPMKSDVYPEQNPPFYYRVADSVMEDLVAAALKKDTIIKFVCGKDVLLHCKNKELLYRVADSHWNEKGAYFAYANLMDLIHKDFPSVTPLKTSQFTFTDTVVSEGLAVRLGLEGIYKEHIPKIRLKNKRSHSGEKTGWEPPPEFKGNTGLETVRLVDNPALPKAIIIDDSYGETLMPFLSENFRKSVFLFDGWHYGPNLEIVDKEKPDIVILEIFSAHWTELYRWK